MESRRLPLKTFSPLSPLVHDYLYATEDEMRPFPKPFSMQALKTMAENRHFPSERRELLKNILKKQYRDSDIEISPHLSKQLDSLTNENTFTVTTGHQLCLFTGPLYFVIKILQAIKLADNLNEENKGHHYVPIFWLASEDHDFEEINHIHLFGKTIRWEREAGGAVGPMNLHGFESVLDEMREILGDSEKAAKIIEIFRDSYREGSSLSSASQRLVHHLFGERGLVVLDANNKMLKNEFVPFFKQEVSNRVIFSNHKKTEELFSSKYKIQVNPRPVNIFYLNHNKRDLIEYDKERFTLKNDSGKNWTEEELLKEIEDHSERFSPNVVLRPMYQECILPNICYVGGGAEIAYWLQLSSSFSDFNLPLPILSLRNSFMWLEASKMKKLRKLDLDINDLFLTESEVVKKLVDADEFEDELNEEYARIQKAFENIAEKITKRDASLEGLVMAEGKKLEKQLKGLEKRLLKSVKSKNEQRLNSFWNLFEKVFPGGNLHERYDNFVPYYLMYGNAFFDRIYDDIDLEDARLNLVIE